MREVVFDTETTGMRFQDGHRMVEIAAIELIDGKKTGNFIDFKINPERSIPKELYEKKIHAVTDDVVKDAPVFKELLPQIVDFFRGARIVAHNLNFDEQFLNHELQLAGHNESIWSIIRDGVDTLDMSRKIWVRDENGKSYRHSLDHILDRCGVDRSERDFHSALLDSELLLEVYLKMQQMIKDMGPTLEDVVDRKEYKKLPSGLVIPKISVSKEDIEKDINFFSQAIKSPKVKI